MNKHTLILALCLIALAFNSQAQNNYSLTLKKAIELGVDGNYDYTETKLDVEKQLKFADEVMTQGFPKLNGLIDYNWGFELQQSPLPGELNFANPGQPFAAAFGRPHNATVQAELSQLVFDSRYFYGLKARKALIKMAGYNVEKGRIDVVEEISKAYYAALVARHIAAELKANQSVLEQLVFETNETYIAGLTDQLSVDRLQLNLSQLEVQIAQSELQYNNALLNLKYTLGLEKNDAIELTDDIKNYLEQNYTLDKGSIENRIEYTMLNQTTELKEYDVKQVRSNLYPNMYLYGRYGTQAFRDKFNFFSTKQQWFDFGSLGFKINVPLFDGLTTRYQVQQKKLDKEINLNQVKAFEEAFTVQVTVAQNNLVNAINQLESQKENLDLAKDIYKKTSIMFTEGIGTSFELSQAQSDLTTAQVNHTQAIYNVLVADLDLKKALGKL